MKSDLALLFAGIGLAAAGCAPDMEWPVDSSEEDIWHSYGQYQKSTNSGVQYLHRGIDIPAPGEPQDTEVLFHGDGTVIHISPAGSDPFQGDVVIADGDRIWRYLHVVADPALSAGDEINNTTVLGTIAPADRPHLHLELVVDGQYDDPLLHLRDRRKKGEPPDPTEILFRTADGDRYFEKGTCSDIPVVTESVDIVVKAHDGFPDLSSGRLANHAIGFKVRHDEQWVIENQLAFRFGQGERDIALADGETGERLVPVIYSTEEEAESRDADGTSPAGDEHAFYYIVTNIGEDRSRIQPSDADHSWNTRIQAGGDHDWNTPDTDDNTADENIDAEFPDGHYVVRAFVEDENDARATANKRIFLNNFDETLTVVNEDGDPAEAFEEGTGVYVTGRGFPANKTYSVYATTGLSALDCISLNGLDDMQVQSNEEGEIPPTDIGSILDEGHFVLILDYDDDQTYRDHREDHVVDPVAGPVFIEGQD